MTEKNEMKDSTLRGLVGVAKQDYEAAFKSSSKEERDEILK